MSPQGRQNVQRVHGYEAGPRASKESAEFMTKRSSALPRASGMSPRGCPRCKPHTAPAGAVRSRTQPVKAARMYRTFTGHEPFRAAQSFKDVQDVQCHEVVRAAQCLQDVQRGHDRELVRTVTVVCPRNSLPPAHPRCQVPPGCPRRSWPRTRRCCQYVHGIRDHKLIRAAQCIEVVQGVRRHEPARIAQGLEDLQEVHPQAWPPCPVPRDVKGVYAHDVGRDAQSLESVQRFNGHEFLCAGQGRPRSSWPRGRPRCPEPQGVQRFLGPPRSLTGVPAP